jgi:hypothetical protein
VRSAIKIGGACLFLGACFLFGGCMDLIRAKRLRRSAEEPADH